MFQPGNLALRNAWFSGGVEWNIGMIGHTPFTMEPMFVNTLTDDDGNPVWHCECGVDGEEYYSEDEFTSKKYGKKYVAYDMLCYILDWEDKDDET